MPKAKNPKEKSRKISEYLKKRYIEYPELKKQISEKLMGNTNGFQKGYQPSEEQNKKTSKRMKEDNPMWRAAAKKKISKLKTGKPRSEETKRKLREANLGKKLSEETKRKIGESEMGVRNSSWKGGITPQNVKIRNSIEMRLWRESVYARDNFTCQKYSIKGGKLIAHHIKNFAQYPELRFAIDNGITLSEKAHIEFHKIYGKKNNTREQLEEFLS